MSSRLGEGAPSGAGDGCQVAPVRSHPNDLGRELLEPARANETPTPGDDSPAMPSPWRKAQVACAESDTKESANSRTNDPWSRDQSGVRFLGD